MTMLLSIGFSIAFTGCGRSDAPTTIVARESQPRQVATDTPIDTYVKDATGKKVLTHDVAKAGEYVVGDSGNKPATKAPGATGTGNKQPLPVAPAAAPAAPQ